MRAQGRTRLKYLELRGLEPVIHLAYVVTSVGDNLCMMHLVNDELFTYDTPSV